MATVLVTGGAGYIGTHVVVALARRGIHSICIDNYSNSSVAAIYRVQLLVPDMVRAYEMDIRDRRMLDWLLSTHEIDGVIHLAGLKSVADSVRFPDRYRDNNVGGTGVLLRALAERSIRRFVFSSSATVYGASADVPYREDSPTSPNSPYGENKLAIETMLHQAAAEDAGWRVVNLRYFNPVGAHPSGLIGEDPVGTPNNLMPYVCRVASGRLPVLRIFGNDYPTRDGTGVRDYIHVMDLAEGHVAALEALGKVPDGTVLTLNLGTGRGHSVVEVTETFERVNGVRLHREFAPRRAGDLAEYFADTSRAKTILGWEAKRGLEEMCRDAWNWQKNNPAGYS